MFLRATLAGAESGAVVLHVIAFPTLPRSRFLPDYREHLSSSKPSHDKTYLEENLDGQPDDDRQPDHEWCQQSSERHLLGPKLPK